MWVAFSLYAPFVIAAALFQCIHVQSHKISSLDLTIVRWSWLVHTTERSQDPSTIQWIEKAARNLAIAPKKYSIYLIQSTAGDIYGLSIDTYWNTDVTPFSAELSHIVG